MCFWCGFAFQEISGRFILVEGSGTNAYSKQVPLFLTKKFYNNDNINCKGYF